MKAVIFIGLFILSMGSSQAQEDEYGHRYGNRFGDDSNSVRLYSPDGHYLGNLNDNRFDPNSVSNPYGSYGNKYSPESINNPYSRYRQGW